MNRFQIAITTVRQLILKESGQDLVEYSLILAMVAMGSVTGMGVLATGLNQMFSTVASTITANV